MTELTRQPQALIYPANTRWGSGSTTCFTCGRTFTYVIGADVHSVQAPDLCDRPCRPAGHWWDCAALGGDLCQRCVEVIAEDGVGNLGLERRARDHQRSAEILTAFAGAEWRYRDRPGPTA